MNKVILMGRLTRDPEISYAQNEKSTCIARYTLAVDRRYKRDGDQQADFIRCTAFGKAAEFVGKYFRKGIKIVVCGRLQTGSYTNNDGQKVYATDVIVEEQDFAESKAASQREASNDGQSYGNYSDSGQRAQRYQQEEPKGDYAEMDDDGELPF